MNPKQEPTMSDKQNTPPPHAMPQGGYYMPMPEDDEIDLLELWQTLWRSKGLIVGVATLCTLVALVVALVMTPVYRAEVLVAPAGDEGGGGLAAQYGGLASMVGISLPGGGGGGVDTAIATLKSRQFIGTFIADENLKPALFAKAWDAEAGAWQAQDSGFAWLGELKASLLPAPPARVSGEPLAPNEPSSWEAYEAFSELLSVGQDKKTGLVTLGIEWADPGQAAAWANALVVRVNAELRARAVAESERSIAYLREQLHKANLEELRLALANLIEEQIKGITFAKATEEYAFKIIDPAVVPERRIKPKRALMVVLGGVLGLMLGVMLVWVRKAIANARAGAEQRP